MRIRTFKKLVSRGEGRVEKTLLGISLFLRIALLFALISSALVQQWFVLFTSSLVLLFSFLPALLSRNYRIHLPVEVEFFITAFLYGSLILGEVHGYYSRFWWWDLILHGTSGMVLAGAGFTLIYILSREHKLKAMPWLLSLFMFSFALAMGALWEIFEFVVDQILGTNMQKSGLLDTMGDLIVDSIGALIVSTIGFLYVKYNKRGLIVEIFEKFKKKNKKLF